MRSPRYSIGRILLTTSQIQAKNLEGLLIKHIVSDAATKELAKKQFKKNWEPAIYTPEMWVKQLDYGYVISPCKYVPKPDGTYTHAGEYFKQTHFFFADADNFIGNKDATEDAVQPWIDRDEIFERYPSLQEKVFAYSESVSSMTPEKPHRRYRLVFLFDSPISTREQFNHIEKLISMEYPIVAFANRAPTHPVFGNARKETRGVEILDNVLCLQKYLNYEIPSEQPELPQTIPVSSPKPPTKEMTLDEFIREQRVPTIRPRPKGGHFVECPWQSHHASGKNSDTDAYIWENTDGTFAFHCSHTTCKTRGNTWAAYREAVAPKRQQPQKPTSPSSPETVPEPVAPVIDIISLKKLEGKVFPELKWVVDDLMPQGLSILAGAPKIGKSFFSWNLALAVSQAGMFLSKYPVKKKKTVLYFALDNDPQRQIQSRLKMIQPNTALPENAHICTEFPIRMQDEGLETWEKTITNVGADLVIVDTLSKVMQSDKQGSAYDQDYNTLGPVHKMVNRMGISMMLVTHTRKMIDADNPYNMIQGSVGIQAACDNLMLLTQSEGEKFLNITGREILPIELAVEISKGTFIATSIEENEEGKLSDIRGAILSALKLAGSDGLPMKSIVESVDESTESNIRHTVRRMVEDQQIYQPKKRGPYYAEKPPEYSSECDDVSL